MSTDAPLDATPRTPHRWHVDFALLALIWGSSFLFIKVAVDELTPVQVSFGRIALGAVAMLVFALVTRQRLPPPGRVWLHLAVVGMLMNAVPFTLFAVGEQSLSSIIAGICNATTPLFALLAAPLVLGGRFGGRRVVFGVLVGFGGVVVLLGPWRSVSGGDLTAYLALLGAAASYGIGTPYIRRTLSGTDIGPVPLSAVQLLLASLMLGVLLPFTGGVPSGGVSAAAWGSVVFLGVLGSGVAYVLFHGVIRAAGPTVAATVTYVMPLVSTVLGVLVLGEALRWNVLVGGVVVLVGVVACARAGQRRAGRATRD